VLKGRASYLFDGTGRAYLDGVNNVCHVGHCHPKVVAAGQAQMAELNTNTRYLHPNIVAYARRLTGMFEDPLSVCFFVNSGSEANELALRMARTATGRKDVVTLGGGYHGNTSTLIDISPYKHDGAGGAGAPDWVFSVPCPDSYRGPHRSPERDLATKYASYVESACRKSAQQGTGVAAFLCEPLIGCGGQIVPPAGYLQQCFQHARAAGALCVADEVQIGFGRVGTHWWGFERDGVVPDIVTLGKPMGNGHPLAAVITTPAIAEAFATGMEYFNTFGGNPVSCAIGSAVLDVLEQEDLRAQAQRVGEHLLAGFRSMAERHACLGDVRGAGLYLGVEFVRCRSEREPAADWLAQVIEDVRDGGLLFSSDGPDHNVLKIKPPMTWTLDEAELALQMVEGALNKLASTTTGLGAPDLSLSPAPLEP
jgi:4-aminobutyrate aminotransferase-like enzyme